ncbi:MAG: hypothetical protein FWG89_02435 [Treponema sp.]|nr:hypothetical protein [Treponema sp.]
MKRMKLGFFAIVIIAAMGFVLASCKVTPSPVTTREPVATESTPQEPVNMEGTTWVWSSNRVTHTYTFVDSENYEVTISGAISESGTGTYTVSNQTVTLHPDGSHTTVSSDGMVSMSRVNSFSVVIRNDTFELASNTFRKR